MKRCPQCNRVETDDTLVFCRVDGMALVNDSSSLKSESGTIQLGSVSTPTEIATSILPHTTDASMNRSTGPTTVLPAQQVGTTNTLAIQKRRIRAIAIVVIATAVIAATTALVVNSYLRTKSNKSIESIAVMPFVNESGNAEVEYLSDGMTETLIRSLSQLPNLAVKSRSTVFYYKGKATSPKKLGEELSVQAVLLGRVAQRGDDLKLDLELVNTRKAAELLDRSPVTLKVLGYVLASVGNRTEALAIAREIENQFAKGNADGRDVAIVYAGLGENDKVFEWLEKDFQSRSSSLAELQLEFPFVPLRNDPRFKALLKRMNLPE